MASNLNVPKNKRSDFSQPLGKLIAGKRKDTIQEVEAFFKNLVKKKPNINFYLVGDIVTIDFLSNPFLKKFIKLCIIDEKTKRSYIHVDDENYFEEIIEFRSPAGSIPRGSWTLLRKITHSEKRTLLRIIEGEEDLLVLPLVLEMPLEKNVENYAFYGQPPITDSEKPIPEGIVMVKVNKTIQNAVKNFINMMKAELLFFKTRVKKYIKGKGCNTSSGIMDELNNIIIEMLDKAIARTKASKRKTVKARDL